MNNIRKKHLKKYGYLPSDIEILDLYRCGELILTDTEEDELLKYFDM